MNKLSKLPRWCHRLYAHNKGYFWIACPLCGRHFGGHEDNGTLWTSINRGQAVCKLHKSKSDIKYMPSKIIYCDKDQRVRLR